MIFNEFQSKKWILLKRFIALQWKLFVGVLVFGILANAITILIPVSISKYYSLIFEAKSSRAFILDIFPGSWVNALPNFLWFFLVLVLCWMLFSFLQKYNTSILGEKFIRGVRDSLFSHQLSVQMKMYDESGFGKYLLRYSGDMNSIRNFLTAGIIRFIIDLLLVLFAVIAMLMTNAYLTMIILCGILITLVAVYFLNKWLYSVSLALRNKKSGLLSFVSYRLPLILTIKGFNRQSVEEKDFNERSERVYQLGVEYQKVTNLIGVIVPGLLYLSLGTILVSIYLLKSSNVQVYSQHLLGFILLFMTVLPVFRRLLRVSSIWKVGTISFDKLQSVMDLKSDLSSIDQTLFKFKDGRIRFKNVYFSYSSGVNILEDFNLRIEGGKTSLVFNSEGLPQSTLIKLISGIYLPKRGTITVDGQNVQEIDQKSLKKKIAILSADFPLLGTTVFEASSYSKATSKFIKVEKMLDDLQRGIPADQKVSLDFKIGDRGHKLTEYQKQIVVCARCFLTEKPLLLIENLSKYSSNPGFLNIIEKLKELQQTEKTIVLFEDSDTLVFNELKPLRNEV